MAFASGSKIVVRLNPLILLVLLLPALFLLHSSYSVYRQIPANITGSDENYYHVYTALGWRRYEREVIDQTRRYEKGSYLEKLDELTRENYYASIELAKDYVSAQRRTFYFLSAFGTFLLLIALFFWFTSKSELSRDTVTVKVPLLRKKDAIDINKIQSLQVIASFPLAPARTEISQINWRDNIVIGEKSGQVVVSLFIFPGFRRIVKEISARRSDIKVSFSARSR